MTIALGFHANDGVLLCADMQKTIGDIKTYDGKIQETIFNDDTRLVLAVAGAGYEDYIRTAREALTRDFPENIRWKNLETELRTRLLQFWRDHLLPWPEHERPSVELLIGVTGRKIPPTLFHYEGTSFSRIHQKAIGCGVLLAVNLINSYCFGSYTLEQLARLAVFIVDKVKEGVEGCGGLTHLTALRKNSDFGFLELTKLHAFESDMKKLEEKSNKGFTAELTSAETKLISWMSEFPRKRAGK